MRKFFDSSSFRRLTNSCCNKIQKSISVYRLCTLRCEQFGGSGRSERAHNKRGRRWPRVDDAERKLGQNQVCVLEGSDETEFHHCRWKIKSSSLPMMPMIAVLIGKLRDLWMDISERILKCTLFPCPSVREFLNASLFSSPLSHKWWNSVSLLPSITQTWAKTARQKLSRLKNFIAPVRYIHTSHQPYTDMWTINVCECFFYGTWFKISCAHVVSSALACYLHTLSTGLCWSEEFNDCVSPTSPLITSKENIEQERFFLRNYFSKCLPVLWTGWTGWRVASDRIVFII